VAACAAVTLSWHKPVVVAAHLGGVMARVKGFHRSRTVTLGVALVAVVVLTGAQRSCESSSSQSESNVKVESDDQAASSSDVRYRVTSSSQISTVTFVDTDGRMTSDVSVNGRAWSGVGPTRRGTVKVFATSSRDGARIECTVTIHGKVVQRASAQGPEGTMVVCEATY
jgi:hypothetical protein